jgi:RNA polymerase II transcription elongation factor
MAVQHSPALPPIRPGLIDPSRQAEYPIVLGKNFLASRNVAANQLLNIRYNWKSKQIPQRQVITETSNSSNSYKLVVREGSSEPYKYSGTADPKTTDPESAYLALVFDKEKSAFVLESISESLNFNLTSATTKPNIEQLCQLETINKSARNRSHDDVQGKEEECADAQNPYDYRHFLAEAKKEAETGSATPKPGMIGTASPTPGATRILTANKASTPLQSPFMGPSTRKKVEAKTTSRGVPRTSSQVASHVTKSKSRTNAVASKGKVAHKSAERTSLSDEELSEVSGARPKSKHVRDASRSQTHARSPQIIVDEASDLTIDMGSPPRKARLKHKINPDAFASNSRGQSRANTASLSPHGRDVRGLGDDAESDVDMDGSDDDDIEDLALPSPREVRRASAAASRVTQDHTVEDEDDDDDDDGLAAEFEAIIDQDDDGDGGMVGLGISGGQGSAPPQHEEESEVSEEE